uniref:Facilitated trehalose transporter Tret1 n=1 Tax=Melanaphis sacchari TaxID=742174 RepID=A0A2H8TDB4_9HEMI
MGIKYTDIHGLKYIFYPPVFSNTRSKPKSLILLVYIFVIGIASSIVCMSNWLFVFLVTKFFTLLVSAIYLYNTFWLFTLFCVLGTFFVVFIVPETKGKTMEEIQELLGADLIPLLTENRDDV